jgi:mannose-6-phosphate isomerase
VHPPATLSEKLGGEPKTENWYVVKSNEKSGLFLGFNQEISKDEFRESLENSRAESLCHRINSSPNDSVLVESGRIHAIDAGNLILEIQQNSDTTYRVFDWGRVGLDGQSRDLHIEESLESITFNDIKPSSIRTSNEYGIETIAKCDHFRIRRLNLSKKSKFKIKDSGYGCTILSPFFGKSSCENQLLEPGASYISPYSSSCEIETDEDCCMLITDCF